MDGLKITPEAVYAAMQSGAPVSVIDVRPQADFLREHIAGAQNFRPERICERVRSWGLSPGAFIAVYCTSGGKSRRAAAELRAGGFLNAWDLGDIDDWPYPLYAD